MTTKKSSAALALLPALLLSSCVTSSTYSRTIDDSGPAWYRDGRIESVRETIRRTEGNPAGGAVAGALIGGLLGNALTGNGGGAVVGAIGGAATGAAVSQGSAEDRYYEVFVRFDDGALSRLVYNGPPPWRSGDRVRETARGLERLGRPSRSPYPLPRSGEPARPPPSPPTIDPPPPPPATPPPPPSVISPPPGTPTPNDGRSW